LCFYIDNVRLYVIAFVVVFLIGSIRGGTGYVGDVATVGVGDDADGSFEVGCIGIIAGNSNCILYALICGVGDILGAASDANMVIVCCGDGCDGSGDGFIGAGVC